MLENNVDREIRGHIAEGQCRLRKRNGAGAQESFLLALEILVFNSQHSILGRFEKRLHPWHRADAQELTQDVFLRVYNYMGRWKSDENVSLILMRVSRWVFLDFLKKNRREMRRMNILMEEKRYKIESQYLEQSDLFNRALNRLLPAQRDFLFNCYSQGNTLEDVAKEYNRDIDSVKKRLNRIENKLLFFIKEFEKDK